MITEDLIPRLIAKASESAEDPDVYFTDQLNIGDMETGYRPVGDEIAEQVDGPVDVFCASVGTAHFALGAAAGLSDSGSEAKLIIFEPASTAVISGNEPGTHHVEGIGIGFVPPMLDPDRCDQVRPIDEDDARAMATRLTREEGLFAGVSSALDIVGAVQVATELGRGHTVVTAAVDTGLKYVAGDLYEG